ncbi:VanZ family protein [Bacillus xiapuensis]|uniref:VanZ family protein n=1 Tax=Bacillus xiapuensis TaxID=2014075 RepID=A0ABU6N713_9BACI|nr:VanZ family protein [Bacillus xiapuensis]
MISKKGAIWLSVIVSQGLFAALIPIWIKLFTYLHQVVMLVVWFGLTIFIFYLVFMITKNTITIPRCVLTIALLIYTCCLLVLLFFRPSDQEYQSYNLVPFKTISFYFSGKVSFLIAFYNLAANVLLFIPYGIYATISAKKKRISKLKRIASPIIAIAFIEILQFITKKGSLDIDDLILNVFGVYLGYELPGITRIIQY